MLGMTATDWCTLVLKVWNPAFSEEEVLVMVCRTGLNTAMGSIIRELLVPAKAAKKDPVVGVRHSILLLMCVLVH